MTSAYFATLCAKIQQKVVDIKQCCTLVTGNILMY